MPCDHSYQGGPYGRSMDDFDDEEEEKALQRLRETLERAAGGHGDPQYPYQGPHPR